MVYSPEEAQIVCSEMKGWFSTGCISIREGRMGVQQTAAESAFFAQQAELAFHAWLFLRRWSLHAGMLALVGFPHWM